MLRLQIVCKNVTVEKLLEVLQEFDEIDVAEKKGHVLVSLEKDQPTDEILMRCREHAYAYFRVVVWEEGGGLERSGSATCVAGLTGEPLRPISLRVHGERGNERHALFGSRNGLVVAEASRLTGIFSVQVVEHHIRGFRLQDPVCVHEGKGDSHEQVLDGVPAELEKYLPLVRASLTKVDCQYCTHSHYKKVKEHD